MSNILLPVSPEGMFLFLLVSLGVPFMVLAYVFVKSIKEESKRSNRR